MTWRNVSNHLNLN